MKEACWNLFETAVSIYEGFNLYYFLLAFFQFRLKTEKHKFIYYCGAVFHICIVTLFNQFMPYEGLLGFVYVLIGFIFLLIFVEGNPFKKFFVSLTATLCVLAANAMVSVFISSIADNKLEDIYTQHSAERMIMILSVQLIVTYVYRIILKAFQKEESRLSVREWILILSVLFLSFAILLMIHIVQLNNTLKASYDNYLLLSSFGVIVINLVCYYMTVNLGKAHTVQIENELLKLDNRYRKNYAENTTMKFEEMRRIRHDMRQSYCVIRNLTEEGKYAELQKYIDEIEKEVGSTEVTVNTENSIVNAILNTKLSEAKNKKIKTLCSTINDFQGFPITDVDLCHLLGNLLDNAIEGAYQCHEGQVRYLEITISNENQMLSINIKNTFPKETFDPDMKTSKRNDKSHGFGVKTIRPCL